MTDKSRGMDIPVFVAFRMTRGVMSFEQITAVGGRAAQQLARAEIPPQLCGHLRRVVSDQQ